MPTNKLSDLEIKVRIIPRRLRWPESDTGIAWSKAHDCASAFDNLIRTVDIACAKVEEDSDISPSAITRRRGEICDQALRKLMNFRPYAIAEAALTREIDALDRLSYPDAEQARMHQIMTKALADLREGIEATRRMVLDRCKMREGVSA